ncbi:hypothetical protein M6B38_411275 [Iris pallida]|uniref:Uncharacterized protein n=1 Tax=Iris pallida TaxID=29817 RepID=A0AAX6FMZ5_IRIPA|nr:hypothetical protein M6B38_411275 [Iris pallida]
MLNDPPSFPSPCAMRAASPRRRARAMTASGQLPTSPSRPFSLQASLGPIDPERASYIGLTHTPSRRSTTGQGSVSVCHDRRCRPVANGTIVSSLVLSVSPAKDLRQVSCGFS